MSDNLRDRISATIDTALSEWMNNLATEGSEANYAAQSIIDDLGLTVETHNSTHPKGTLKRVVGEWQWDRS